MIVVTIVAPTLRPVSMSGTGLTIMRIAFDVLLSIIPGILAANACVRINRGQWKLSRRNKVLLLAAGIVFLLIPATDLGFLNVRPPRNMGGVAP